MKSEVEVKEKAIGELQKQVPKEAGEEPEASVKEEELTALRFSLAEANEKVKGLKAEKGKLEERLKKSE